MSGHKVAYIYNANLRKYCDQLPTMKYRSTIVQDLILAYKLHLGSNIKIINPIEASYNTLLLFHSKSYIDYIKSSESISSRQDPESNEKVIEALAESFGLLYDCPLMKNTFQFVTTVAGASITAAQLLNSAQFKYVINWFGGWHHAQSAKASGFCYVNDIVLAIHELNKTFSRVLYLDLDVHHGDGVEAAFKDNKNVLTCSIHKCSPGFYPGSGLITDCDEENCIVNVPLLDGISCDTYLYVFKKVFKHIFDDFKPKAMVIQCGADILAGDPLGECNVTIQTMTECVQELLRCDKPTLFLGGGGYNSANTARYWCSLTALILSEKIEEDIPDTAQFFSMYTPTFELKIDPLLGCRDYNTKEYLHNIVDKITKLTFNQ